MKFGVELCHLSAGVCSLAYMPEHVAEHMAEHVAEHVAAQMQHGLNLCAQAFSRPIQNLRHPDTDSRQMRIAWQPALQPPSCQPAIARR